MMYRDRLFSVLLLALLALAVAGCALGSPITPLTVGVDIPEVVEDAPAPAVLEPVTLVVDTAADPPTSGDAAAGCTAAPDDCSLRRALVIANGNGRPTDIRFADSYHIVLHLPLPPIAGAGTTLVATMEQEVHLDGRGQVHNIVRVEALQVSIRGLRLYGAGPGASTIWVADGAHEVVIAGNVIGDDDRPAGDCGQSPHAYGGIYVDADQAAPPGPRAVIYGNVIECHGGQPAAGYPGDGITILTDRVWVGVDLAGEAGDAQRNQIRHNAGAGVRLGDYGGNKVTNSLIYGNGGQAISVSNFNNDLFGNEIRAGSG